ncbi:MAG: PAS domain S-box protein [Acidobacteria bacterium]|nr:PAS domain S-box protein [Acidobacteriota bacterium]
MTRLGLRGRFVAFVSAMIVAFGVILTALTVREQNERLSHELEERGKLLTTVVSANATDAMALLDIRELRRLIAEARAQENVVDIVAFDEEGRVLTDGTVKNVRRHELIPEAARRHAAVSEGLLVEFDEDTMVVTKPVLLGSEPLGGVMLRYSLAGLAKEQASLARRTAAVGTVFALLGVLAAALLTEAITRPLKEVIDATRAVTDGETVPRLPVRTSDEVGTLAESFNEMMRKLRDTTVSRDFLDRVVETMGECLVVTGPDGTITHVNPAVCKLSGVSEGELLGQNCRDLFRAPEGRVSLLEAVGPDGSAQGLETELLAKGGEAVPVLVSVGAMKGKTGRRRGYVLVAADISERLRHEQQKDEFVTMVHHEVRGPLTAVRGAIGLLDGGVAGELGERGQELVEIALRNSKRMDRLVNDLLAARKLHSGRMTFQFEETELMPLIEQAIEGTDTYAGGRDIRIEIVDSVPGAQVTVDPDRLIQVLTNVVSNAVRFSSPEGVVAVAVDRRDDGLRIAISDSGPGIAEDFRDRVFEAFARDEREDWRHRSGSGLGMCISKGIIEELGGSISFETEVGAGTTFFVDIPEIR